MIKRVCSVRIIFVLKRKLENITPYETVYNGQFPLQVRIRKYFASHKPENMSSFSPYIGVKNKMKVMLKSGSG